MCPCWEASIRAEPRKAPTQGVQPTENTIPRSSAGKKPTQLAGAARLEPRAEEPEEKHTEDAEKAVDKSPERAYIDRSALTDDQIELLAALEEKKLLADDLIELTQIPARRVLSALTMLQVQGYVAERPGRRFEALVWLKTE